MILAIAGHSRGVGKSSLACSILRAFSELDWIALKISPHRHRAPVDDSFSLSRETAGHRFVEAGAREAYLLRAPDDQVAAAVDTLTWLKDPSRHILVESNRLVALRHPDLLVFACDPSIGDWKDSSAYCVPRADAFTVVQADDDPRLAAASAPRFRVSPPHYSSPALEQWLAERLR